MASILHSDNWYRVEALHPRLRSHIEVQRRRSRGKTWYVLRDQSSGRYHRVSETAYQIVGRLTGQHTVHQVWEIVLAKLGQNAPTQDEVIALLSTLHEGHLIQSEVTPNVDEMFARRDHRTRQARHNAVNPLSFRVPLVDPSQFLDRWAGWARPLYTRTAFVCWALVVLLAGMALAPHWQELLRQGGTLLENRQLLLLVLVYPFVKALHELGHAFAVRVWGGEVREMGVALMLFIPVPYVDASAASGFKERHRRVVVSAAGIMVELFLAALAAVIWLNVEPGWTRDIAFTVMAVGGVSTALFNGNPLMRLDGYFVLCDAIETPNLAARANQAGVALLQKYLLGVRQARSPASDRFELWFLPGYAVASTAYRILISLTIVLWVASKSVILAAALAGLMLFGMLLKPLHQGIGFLAHSRVLQARRGVAVGNTLLAAGTVLALFVFVPLPSSSTLTGVVWFPEQAQVRAQVSGFVEQVFKEDGAAVVSGDLILELTNPGLEAQHSEAAASVQALEVRMRQAMRERPAEMQSTATELAAMNTRLRELSQRVQALRLYAEADGTLVLPRGYDLPGSFVKQGATLGHVVTPDDMIVRVAATQEQAGRIRDGVVQVEVRLLEHPDVVHDAGVVREVPAADTTLQSAALGDRGGGQIRTDPADPEGLKTAEPVYFFDLIVRGLRPDRVGGRVLVRTKHASESLASRLMRSLRQAFLRHADY